MTADGLHGFLRLGVMVGGCGLIMALVQPRESPQFILSVCSAGMGLALIVGVLVVARLIKSGDQS